MCAFVGLLPRQLEIACINPHQTGFVVKGSDHLQLIKLWPSRAPGRGSAAGGKFLVLPYYSQCAVFVSLSAFSLIYCSRPTSNASFFAEVEQAFRSVSKSRMAVGGNSAVMAQRFVSEGVDRVVLGANMSPGLLGQLDQRVRGDLVEVV